MENTNPITFVVLSFLTPRDRAGNVYRAFRYIRCSDGAMVEGRCGNQSGDSNLRMAFNLDPVTSCYRYDYVWIDQTMAFRDMEKLPYAGCGPSQIAIFVHDQLPKEPRKKKAKYVRLSGHHKFVGKDDICQECGHGIKWVMEFPRLCTFVRSEPLS